MSKTNVPAHVPGHGALTWFSHSLGYVGATNNVGCAQITADMLGVDIINRAVGAAVLCYAGGFGVGLGAGGWDWTYRYTGTTGASTEGVGVPKRGPVIYWLGINDIATMPGTAGVRTPANFAVLGRTLRAALSRCRATDVFEDTDLTTMPTATNWTRGVAAGSMLPGSGNQASGATRAQCTVANSPLTINVPATFLGGVIGLGFLADSTGAGGLFTISVDGTPVAGAIDTRAAQHTFGAFSWTQPQVYRTAWLAAGAHTIVITPTVITTTAYFDAWWTEADNPVGVPLHYLLPPANGTSDTDVNALNTVTQSIVDEFAASSVASGRTPTVGTIPTDDLINKSAALISTDNLHLRDPGHAVVGERFRDYLRRLTPSRATQAGGARSPIYVSRHPNASQRNELRPQLGSTSPLTIYQSDSLDAQTADLLPLKDPGTGLVIGGFSKRAGLKFPNIPTVDGRMNWGASTATFPGASQLSSNSAAVAHGLGRAFTADTVSGSVNLGHQFAATKNGTTALSGVSPAFTAADVTKPITGPGIQAGTTLVSQTGTAGVMSLAATDSGTPAGTPFVVVGQTGLTADDVGRPIGYTVGGSVVRGTTIQAVGTGWATLTIAPTATANGVTMSVVPLIMMTSVSDATSFFVVIPGLQSIDATSFIWAAYSVSTVVPNPGAGTRVGVNWLAIG